MNQSNVTLRQMRAFITVADAGGFAAASRLLHVTPSALSLLIKEIETVIEVRLFDRSTRHVALSAAGRSFLPVARNLLRDLEEAIDGLRDVEQKRRGAIRVACTPLYAATFLPRVVRGYRERYPAITVYVVDSLHEQALDRVLSGEADLAIAPQRTTPPVLVQEPLLADRMWLVCRGDHPLARRKHVQWTHVVAEPFISLTSDFTAQLQADLARYSDALQLRPAHNVSFITTALGMVQSGFGITAQPASALMLLPPFGLVARPLALPVVHRHLSLYRRSDRTLTAAAASFRTYLWSGRTCDTDGAAPAVARGRSIVRPQ